MDARTEEIRARVERATPEPWTRTKPEKDADGWSQGICIGATVGGKIYATPPGGSYPAADADFIAHARSDVPYLLTELSALREEVERLKGALGRCQVFFAERPGWDEARELEEVCYAALSPSPEQQEKKC